MKLLVTGSSGLIGSAVVRFFLAQGQIVIGIDNNQRQKFFGEGGSTLKVQQQLQQLKNYSHVSIDITDTVSLTKVFEQNSFDAIIHCAAQPSHDKAKDFPILDFETNAVATVQLLELTRLHSPNAVFIFTSTNKVYGDNPNKLKLKELPTRFELDNLDGIDETLSLDDCTHSLFGAGKLAADVYVQEYGRYFGMKTACLRLGCVTGKNHAGVALHGFLSYLIKSAIKDRTYHIIGYKGKQVRDQIDADDVALAMNEIIQNPCSGEAFNLGGGRENAASILELLSMLEKTLGYEITTTYEEKPRVGDHICYITDFSKFNTHYPQWKITKKLPTIIDEIILAQTK